MSFMDNGRVQAGGKIPLCNSICTGVLRPVSPHKLTESAMTTETIQKYIPYALSLEKLHSLPTPRLLAYYKKYRWVRHYGVEILNERDKTVNQLANEYMDAIKEILDSREHVA
jgi:hypothetical protein